jgi:hypothetical protein
MSTGQLVMVAEATSKIKYGVIVQVMTGVKTEDSYIVLIGNEFLILTGADIAEI